MIQSLSAEDNNIYFKMVLFCGHNEKPRIMSL